MGDEGFDVMRAKIVGKLWVFLVLGVFLGAGAVFGYTGSSSEVLDSFLAQLENVSFKEEPLPHYRGRDDGELIYFFQSNRLQTSASGFAGSVDLIIAVDSNRIIHEVIIESSQETPAYLAKIKPWLDKFKQKPLSDFTRPEKPVDTVTHATHSSRAVIETVSDSAVVILNSFFNQQIRERTRKVTGRWQAFILIFFSLGGVFLFHKNRSRKIRYLFFLLLVAVLGWGLNLQFSFSLIANLMELNFPSIFQFSLIALIFIPLFLAFFYGRIYCGWLCPFGALQELLFVLGRPVKVPEKVERKAKFIKYFLLAALIFLIFFNKDGDIFRHDPLSRIFNPGSFFAPESFLLWAALFFSLFIVRFWCRYFCPTGAFLSLFNKIALLKGVFKKKFSRCPWFVKRLKDPSCLLCNRCQDR